MDPNDWDMRSKYHRDYNRHKINLYSKFYKVPDGEECLQKTFYYTQYSGIFGAVFSFYEMVLHSKPTTVSGVIRKFGRFTLPFAGMGFVFGSSLCILGQLRGKSDYVNHLFAGGFAGIVWGVKYRSIQVGHIAAVVFGFGAAYLKYFDDIKVPAFQMRTPEMSHNLGYMDLTIKLYDDPGRPMDP